MKRLLILGAVATLVAACGPKQNAKPDPLVVANDSLSQVIAAKDSIINDAFNSIGEIAASIDRIAEHERLVTAAAASGTELSKPMKERVAENITAISELLDKNRAAIARLQVSADKLKEARVQIGGLERLITQLQEQLDQKNTQLASLTDQVKAMKVEIAALGHTVTNLEQDKTELQGAVAEQDAQLHTVYYIVGKEKELLDDQIIDKKGFIGRTRVMNDQAKLDDFTAADDRVIERIPIGKNRVRIVTIHPETSYILIKGDNNQIEELVITDKDAFWQNSRMLVISHR
ncbi:hypothetical protein [uncultured Rikenella sp.]|mgnify:FL=1|uniref:Cbp1 family collagen-binding glycoprotein adhesin n=1 Tax=uncultured Rikenella sp. TaxID=368003 RepID=UPI002610BF33|nr:hypothetical protein [uncultured Rikenella sp.]